MKCRRPLVVPDAPAALLPFVQPNALAAPWVKEGIDKQREDAQVVHRGPLSCIWCKPSFSFPMVFPWLYDKGEGREEYRLSIWFIW